MKKNNKVLTFIASNWYFVLLVIPFIFFCIANRNPDNDIWFLLNNGKYVLKYGIPQIEPFTIHEGFNYVMQQWASASLFYLIYSKLGKYGILSLMFILYFVITFVYYKVCYYVSKNKFISVLVTTIILYLSREYIVTRPQTLTYLILIIEWFLTEKYAQTNNWKYLVSLPLLSLLLINSHASMWLLQFVFLLPTLCNCVKIKNITVDKIKMLPLLITFIIMFLVGFINPYGFDAILFIFKSYGTAEIDSFVMEMKVSAFTMYHFACAIYLLLILFILILVNKKVKLDLRYILLLCGTFLFSTMHIKCVPYFFFYSGFILSKILSFYTNFNLVNKIKKIMNKRFIMSLSKGFCIGLFLCLVVTFIYTSLTLYKNYKFENVSIPKIVEYVKDNYDVSDVVMFIGFDEGGYTEFNGIKSYIDPRAEVFHDRLNEKENIFREYVKLIKGELDVDLFLKKYNFTHLIVHNIAPYYDDVVSNEDYFLEYSEDARENVITYQLFVRKDISIGGERK